MCTFARLEVTSEGFLAQSSYAVPPSGDLPRPQSTVSTPERAKVYSNSIFGPCVYVAVKGKPGQQQVKLIYIPRPLRGRRLMILVFPVIFTLIILSTAYPLFLLNPITPTILYLLGGVLLTSVVSLMVLAPSFWWARYMYYQGAPDSRLQRKLLAHYPDIPIYRDRNDFLVDAARY